MASGGKREFGRVRKLPSGRYQARYQGPDGVDRPAPHTFPNKRMAERWLADQRADIMRDDWVDPTGGGIIFGPYAEAWVKERPLEASSRQLYDGLLRNHLGPTFNDFRVVDIKEAAVRAWRAKRLDDGAGPIITAKAYRLLRAILNTAVDDGIIRRNPCRIKGAGDENSPERPVISVAEVLRLAESITPRYRALVLLAAFGCLRWGELVMLRRSDIDLDRCTVRVRLAAVELKDGSRVVKAPKSAAGLRTVTFPAAIVEHLHFHLRVFAVQDDPDGMLFVGPKGAALRRSNFSRVWNRARKKAELEHIHFHDLRHAGNTLAAETGASLRDLMNRMGHSTVRAALIYQHRSKTGDQKIADAVDGLIKKERGGPDDEDGDGSSLVASGT